jgi:glycosyltransferase involved in cell wall biosynthesis
MKILLVSNSDSVGGASIAAFRLLQALNVSPNTDAKMFVKSKTINSSLILSKYNSNISRAFSLFRSPIGSIIQKLQKTENYNLHSGNWLPSFSHRYINNSDCDIVNLHWINAEFLSIEDIGKINKPVVMTLHDMWAFCGSEHVTDYSSEPRFKSGYLAESKKNKGIDLDRLVWLRKKHAWKNNITIVCPSQWLADCAKQSALFSNHSVHVIPNALDTKTFKPLDKDFCRSILGLPKDKKLIGFSAWGGSSDVNKGFDLLRESLEMVESDIIEGVVLGQSDGVKKIGNVGINYLGHLHDKVTLSIFYNALDLVVIPSRIENQSQIASEAASCGVPVVAFNTSGLKDSVDHLLTGYLAEPFKAESLFKGIDFILESKDYNDICDNAREKALQTYSEEKIMTMYNDLFSMILNG